MTEKELKRLRHLPQDLEDLQEKEEEAKERYASYRTHSVVQASSRHLPYSKHAVTVTAPEHHADALQALAVLQKARENVRECEQEIARLEEFIADIPDPDTRKIFTMYYKEGKTWQVISTRFGRQSEFWSRNIAKNYFHNIENIDFDSLKFKMKKV